MNEEENKVEVTETEEVKVEETPAEVPQAEDAPTTEKKEVDLKDMFAGVKKNIKWIVIAVVALILICIIGSCAANSGSAYTLENEKNTYYTKDSETLVNLDGEEIEVDEGVSGITYSADKSLAVVKDGEGTLFVIDGTKLVEVDVEVNYFVISNYGDSIAYITDKEDGVGTLHLYNVSKNSSEEIADEVYAGDIVLSADGKSVAYITDCEVEEGWFSSSVTGSVYVSKNGKEGKKVSGDAVPVAVTDGGKHVFYIKDGEKLYMDEEKLASGISSRIYFNDDYTELVFIEDDDTQYFTVKMKEPVKVKKGIFSGIYAPAKMVKASRDTSNAYTVDTYGVESFDETLWRIDRYEAYYVYDKGEETEKVCSNLTQYQMSTNGKAILYQDGGELLLIENIAKSREGERIAHGLYNSTGFVASEDLKDVYYYNAEDDELCYIKKGEGVRLADDADVFVYSDKYNVLYFIEDDELFYVTKTAKSKKDVCGEEVSSVFVINDEVYFTYEEDDVYSIMKMTGKAKYETLFELDMENIWNFDFDDLF